MEETTELYGGEEINEELRVILEEEDETGLSDSLKRLATKTAVRLASSFPGASQEEKLDLNMAMTLLAMSTTVADRADALRLFNLARRVAK
jgi:hypothetical protein